MDKLTGTVRVAVEKYNLIDDGDRIAVAVSGGKDSLYLLYSLSQLSRYYPKKFTLEAVTVDTCFGGKHSDFSEIERICESINVPYTIKRTDIGPIVFDRRQEKNPCSLCARMRRAVLHDFCNEHNLNKIALGHHYDDAVQTFFMNLLYGGKIGCFSPKTYLSRKNITMIRPLVFCEERKIRRNLKRLDWQVVRSECPVDGFTARKDTEDFIRNLQKDFPDIRAKVMGAMQRSEVDGW